MDELGSDLCSLGPFKVRRGHAVQLIGKLYETTSILFTTHLAFKEWARTKYTFFEDTKIDTKIIAALLAKDTPKQITHHCKIIETGNSSYRFAQSRAALQK